MTLAARASDTDVFAMAVWRTMPKLKGYAKRLWKGDAAAAEDGLQETVCRAIASRHRFTGGNLGAWLNRILRNIRCDQLAKGYRKGHRQRGVDQEGQGRLLFYASYADIEGQLVDRCDPEGIMIAMEEHQCASITGFT